jgi:lipid II:glycine glycyltransferase (peptidoglycan interpeptide bridge formation enzyme)
VDVIQVGPAERARYDAAVAGSPLADVMQTYGWGEVKGTTGWDAMRLLVVDEHGRARAACSILRTRPARGMPPLLYAPRGPVLDFADSEALGTLLAAIRARAGTAFLFKCDPPVEAGSAEASALLQAGLRPVRSGPFGGTQPAAVMLLDLSAGVDKVFEGFKPKWRYNIRLAERKGVVVRPATRQDLPAWHAIYLETAARDGFTGRGLTYFQTLFDVLEPVEMMRMWVAEHDGVMLAGIIVMSAGERSTYVYGASSGEGRNLMPNHLLQWEAIQWSCERGMKVYDLHGVSPVRDGEPVEPHLAGLNRFKEGFGADYVDHAGEFDLPLRAGWYALWRTASPAAMKAVSMLRRMRRRG